MSKALWDYVSDISYLKRGEIDEDFEKVYYPITVNTVFSKFSDSIFYVQDMNIRPEISKLAHYKYLIYSLSARKRFKKGKKRVKNKYFDIVQKHYGYSNDKTEKALALLPIDYLKKLTKLYDEGGLKK